MTTSSDVVTLWRAAAHDEIAGLSESGWLTWPRTSSIAESPLTPSRARAIDYVQRVVVPWAGIGFVVAFDVQVRNTKWEALGVGEQDTDIAPDAMEELERILVGHFREEMEYRRAVADHELRNAEIATGTAVPAPWRDFLTRPAWLHKGWLANGCFIWLYSPRESANSVEAGEDLRESHPGILLIGSDGASEQLAVDSRERISPVVLVNIASSGWRDALPQARSLGQFIDNLDSETFEFTF